MSLGEYEYVDDTDSLNGLHTAGPRDRAGKGLMKKRNGPELVPVPGAYRNWYAVSRSGVLYKKNGLTGFLEPVEALSRDGTLWVTLEVPGRGGVRKRLAEVVLRSFGRTPPHARARPQILYGRKGPADCSLKNLRWGRGSLRKRKAKTKPWGVKARRQDLTSDERCYNLIRSDLSLVRHLVLDKGYSIERAAKRAGLTEEEVRQALTT